MINQQAIRSVGIIGLGNFGRFIVPLMPKNIRVLGFDLHESRSISSMEHATIDEVCDADVIFLAIPLKSYPKVLADIRNNLRPETLIVDICSVKMKPEQLIREHLPGHSNVLMTHPLFGPQSAASGTAGHRLIVTAAVGDKAESVLRFCRERLGLVIDEMSSERHDRAMAQVHALTFFVARGLRHMDLEEEIFQTPSYKMIMDFVDFDARQSDDLFETIELGNPFAKEMRQRLLSSLVQVENHLDEFSQQRKLKP